MQKQVDAGHYEFSSYMNKQRWASMWCQLAEVMGMKPNRVLEIGPGPGLFRAAASSFGVRVETMDIDPDLNPDYVASVLDMPFHDNEFDVVCAFQMLEHLPYAQSLQAFREMTRVASKGVVISLPDAQISWPISFCLPKVGEVSFSVPRPRLRLPIHQFDGEHYWEINKRGYELSKIIEDFAAPGLSLKQTYRVNGNLYHRFFIYEKSR